MKRIKLTVAYDGTNYHGWQIQPNAVTVEGELNKAISELTGKHIEVIGASRTDAGVHALGNVAVFDTESRIPGEKFSYALNQRLPEDIIIQSSEEVALDFHPRYQECRKTYEYTILNRKFPLPEYRNTAHFDYGNLDVKAMQDACKAFIGEHDFAGFCSAGAQVKTTIRTIYSLEVECIELGKAKPDGENSEDLSAGTDKQKENDRLIRIRVNGNGFLYNMFSCLCKHLNCDIIGNKIFVNKTANKFKFSMRRCRKTYFDFLKTKLYKEFEKFDFFFCRHR